MSLASLNSNNLNCASSDWKIIGIKVDKINKKFQPCCECKKTISMGILIENVLNPSNTKFYDKKCIKKTFNQDDVKKVNNYIKSVSDLKYKNPSLGLFSNNIAEIKNGLIKKIFTEQMVEKYNYIISKKAYKKSFFSCFKEDYPFAKENYNFIVSIERVVFKELTRGSKHWSESNQKTDKNISELSYKILDETENREEISNLNKDASDSGTDIDELISKWITPEISNSFPPLVEQFETAKICPEEQSNLIQPPIPNEEISNLNKDVFDSGTDIDELISKWITPEISNSFPPLVEQFETALMSFDSARQSKIEAKRPNEEDHSQKESEVQSRIVGEKRALSQQEFPESISSYREPFHPEDWKIIGIKNFRLHKGFQKCHECNSTNNIGFLFENVNNKSIRFYDKQCSEQFISQDLKDLLILSQHLKYSPNPELIKKASQILSETLPHVLNEKEKKAILNLKSSETLEIIDRITRGLPQKISYRSHR